MNLQELEHRIELIIPRLRFIENYGDGATIHTVRGLISVINGWYALSAYSDGREDPTSIQNCLDAIDKAERFMIDLVKEINASTYNDG